MDDLKENKSAKIREKRRLTISESKESFLVG
jgi:hypothetical protein